MLKVQQIRNATIILEFGSHRILVDPMLATKGALPPLRLFGARLRNPLVDLPESAFDAIDSVTHCLITHCQKGHFDHLDRAAKRWLKEKQIPVICTPQDATYLAERGLNIQPLSDDHREGVSFLGGKIRTVKCTHGNGLTGNLMEYGVGYFIEIPGEPSVYLSGDTILTPAIRKFVRDYQPQFSVVPAGGTRFDIGEDLIMGIEEVVTFARISTGTVIANHLEAIGHWPVTRSELAAAAKRAGMDSRLRIPADGEVLELTYLVGHSLCIQL